MHPFVAQNLITKVNQMEEREPGSRQILLDALDTAARLSRSLGIRSNTVVIEDGRANAIDKPSDTFSVIGLLADANYCNDRGCHKLELKRHYTGSTTLKTCVGNKRIKSEPYSSAWVTTKLASCNTGRVSLRHTRIVENDVVRLQMPDRQGFASLSDIYMQSLNTQRLGSKCESRAIMNMLQYASQMNAERSVLMQELPGTNNRDITRIANTRVLEMFGPNERDENANELTLSKISSFNMQSQRALRMQKLIGNAIFKVGFLTTGSALNKISKEALANVLQYLVSETNAARIEELAEAVDSSGIDFLQDLHYRPE